MLILSADVAGGHDASARVIAATVAKREPDAVIAIENGLLLASPRFHRVARDGYKWQLTHASLTYVLLFRSVWLRPVPVVLRRLLALCFGRRFYRAIRAFAPDLIVSTFPMVNALLAEGRRRGEIAVPVAAVVTDADPHPFWFAPAIDLHLVCTPRDVERVKRRCARLAVSAALPPIRDGFLAAPDAAAARASMGFPAERRVVLVSGGGWGLGDLDDVVAHLTACTDAFLVAACGANEPLRQRLEARYPPSTVRALPHWEDMPALFAACDVLVHTGAGLTCLEAVAAGLPTVLYNVVPGHGPRSAAALVTDGMLRWAHSPEDLVAAVRQASRDPGTSHHATSILQLPSIADLVIPLAGACRDASPARPPRRPGRLALAAALLALVALPTGLHQAYPTLTHALRAFNHPATHAGRIAPRARTVSRPPGGHG